MSDLAEAVPGTTAISPHYSSLSSDWIPIEISSRSIEMQGSKDLVKLIPQQSRYEANHSWRRSENVSCPLVPLLPFAVVSFEDCSVLGFE